MFWIQNITNNQVSYQLLWAFSIDILLVEHKIQLKNFEMRGCPTNVS